MRQLIADPGLFLSDPDAAVPMLLDVLPYADNALVLNILPLLGGAGKDRALWPLFALVTASSRGETIQRTAAVYLALAASMSHDPSGIRTALVDHLNHPDPAVRIGCILALGWEGNRVAMPTLLDCLGDPHRDVQAAAVTALSSVGDPALFDLFVTRLNRGGQEEQRSILLHLWQFEERRGDVEAIYLHGLKTLSAELRADLLAGLSMLPLSTAILDAYRHLVTDSDPLVRGQLLENISRLDPDGRHPVRTVCRQLAGDPDRRIRQAAIRLWASWPSSQ